MADVPERVWIYFDELPDAVMLERKVCTRPTESCEPYIRSDIADAAVQEARRETWQKAIGIVKAERHGQALHQEWSQVHHDAVDRMILALEAAAKEGEQNG